MKEINVGPLEGDMLSCWILGVWQIKLWKKLRNQDSFAML